ncbi:hypothetical protein MXL46_08030 [Heyndrickxia sporothermodurans]|uniref:hypothetical protein n=1 Tax=Heyndrickxia sporothermodurans TaxID=46224 RepID=UPI002DBDF5E4|nr:hypothetical protein [Heyndrickxia sporothermodurans]MEB6549042.1 hypothetical protein [Heyndrickxia sporothermodurans]
MVIKINGKTLGETLDSFGNCKGHETLAPLLDCSNVPVPNLSQIPNPNEYAYYIDYLIARLDHFNYSMMSKTEVTDSLYRFFADIPEWFVDLSRNIVEGVF